MSYQIKRSNKSVVVVERWYVDGIQKERHVMTIESYTTSERLHELQAEFRGSKGKMPKKTYQERRDKIVRLSNEDIERIKDSLVRRKKYQTLDTDKAQHSATISRIADATDTRHSEEAIKEWKEIKTMTLAKKQKEAKEKAAELAAYKKREKYILER